MQWILDVLARALQQSDSSDAGPPRPSGGRHEDEAQPGPPATPDDPIRRALDLLARRRAGRQCEIVQFLAGRPDMEASLAEIAVGVYKARECYVRRAVPTVRKRAEVMRDTLEHENAPVRLEIALNRARLIVVDAPHVART